jgi:1,2-diacylglycerol 3-alpha-glucosyltransferase
MKILIASDTYYPSVNGAAYFTYRLATMLEEKGHDVFVICPSQSFHNTISHDQGVTVYGIQSIHIPVYQNLRIALPAISRKTIKRVIENISPDVIHVQNHFVVGKGALLAAKKMGIPIIGTNHFVPENLLHYFHLPPKAEHWLQTFGWKECVSFFEQLDAVTVPTKTAATLLQNAGFTKTILPVSCGIDLERFNPSNNGSYLKERYHVPTDTRVLLYVGRLDKEKEVDVILRALPKVLQTMNITLVLAGIGKERSHLELLVKKLGIEQSVVFTGFIPDKDLQNIYTIADLFVIASIAELQSIVTMEAMASGLPVVAADAMALPELAHTGKNGYLFPAGDSETLAKKIGAIFSDPALQMRMSEKSRDIIQHHDIHKTIEIYEELYRTIITRYPQKNLV